MTRKAPRALAQADSLVAIELPATDRAGVILGPRPRTESRIVVAVLPALAFFDHVSALPFA